MADASAQPHPRLDELYRAHPEGFVAARNELVKELRRDGRREQAARVKGLRRPTAAAWLLNRVALTEPRLLARFERASGELESAQARALEGNEKAAGEWRAAAGREREAAAAILDAAAQGARADGHPAGERALELADETLRAASADPGLRERVVAGRVERERSAATLGTPQTGAAPRRGDTATKRREAARDRRERERLERELADAEAREQRLRARVEEATQALRREKAKLTEAKRETTAQRRRLQAARRRGG